MFTQWALQESEPIISQLLTGVYSTVSRKGGIHEPHGGLFRLNHAPALLVGTHYHQHSNKPTKGNDLVESGVRQNTPNIHLRTWFDQAVCWRVTDKHALAEVAPHLPISLGELETRFHYREPWIMLIALRLYLLPDQVLIPKLPGYGGCRSWLKLDREIELTGEPVLDDDQWQQHLALFQGLLSPMS